RCIAERVAARMPADRSWLPHRTHRRRPTDAPVPVHRRATPTARSAAFRSPFAGTALPASQRRCAVRLAALMRKEWLLLVRDHHALAVLFLMPALFVLLMAFALAEVNQDRLPALELVLE